LSERAKNRSAILAGLSLLVIVSWSRLHSLSAALMRERRETFA